MSNGSEKKDIDVTTDDVRQYWENNPLFSLEIKDGYGEEKFFKELERIKVEDTEIFTSDYWGFNKYNGKKVLDIGCGPGWYTVSYGRGGADVTGVDLTERAVTLASKFIEFEGLENTKVRQADAQNLPFENETFDLVASSGVLHHVPDPLAAFREVRRVLKPEGEAKITLYYKSILLRSSLLFKLMMLALRLLKAKHHDVVSGDDPKTPEDFVRMYDGKQNPLGIAKDNPEWTKMFNEAGLEVISSEVHFFPVRFVKKNALLKMFRRFFDANFGFLIYYRLKPR